MLRTRIAPTPSGYLHLGNMYNFVLTWLIAKSQGGQLLLRIDDLDKQRLRPEYVEDIFTNLQWIGLTCDEGPDGPTQFMQQWSQHLRIPIYTSLLQTLQQAGLLYGCTYSRTQIQQALKQGQYPPTARNHPVPLHHTQAAWRVCLPPLTSIRVPDAWAGPIPINLWQQMPDFVVRQKNALPAYQLASLADDVHFGINTLVRGMDLLPGTAAQLWLASHIPQAKPFLSANFYHHPLLTTEAGTKLSKSAGSYSLQAMRNQGLTPARLIQVLAGHLGITTHPLPQSLPQLLEQWLYLPQKKNPQQAHRPVADG